MTTDLIPVPDAEGVNVIYIRPRMMWGVKNRVQSAAVQISVDMAGGNNRAQVTVAAYQVALLLNNIVKWEGPALAGFALTQAGLDNLDPDHGDAVLAAINAANPPRTSPNPKAPTTNTSTSAGATNTPAS